MIGKLVAPLANETGSNLLFLTYAFLTHVFISNKICPILNKLVFSTRHTQYTATESTLNFTIPNV